MQVNSQKNLSIRKIFEAPAPLELLGCPQMVKDAILIDEKDNVATALRDLTSKAEITLKVKDEEVRIKLTQPIPFGHKFAVTRIPAGGSVIKYGEVIGVATQEIGSGEHAHVHNIKSTRGGGSQP